MLVQKIYIYVYKSRRFIYTSWRSEFMNIAMSYVWNEVNKSSKKNSNSFIVQIILGIEQKIKKRVQLFHARKWWILYCSGHLKKTHITIIRLQAIEQSIFNTQARKKTFAYKITNKKIGRKEYTERFYCTDMFNSLL